MICAVQLMLFFPVWHEQVYVTLWRSSTMYSVCIPLYTYCHLLQRNSWSCIKTLRVRRCIIMTFVRSFTYDKHDYPSSYTTNVCSIAHDKGIRFNFVLFFHLSHSNNTHHFFVSQDNECKQWKFRSWFMTDIPNISETRINELRYLR